MKRRIGGACYTGLGGGGESIMDGKPTKSKKINNLVNKASKECYELFFKGTQMDFEYCDADYKPNQVTLGIEPSYMYQRLKIIVIDLHKHLSYIETGYSYGPWGTGLRSSKKYYKEYKNNTKFTKFINKWHKLFYGE